MAQSLSQIFLDQDRIDSSLRGFDEAAIVIGPTNRGQFTEYHIECANQEVATLHFYFRNDSTTTIGARVGKNHVLSQQIGEHVAKECQKKEFLQQPLTLAHITKENWDFLIKHLSEDYGYTVIEGKVPHGLRFDVKNKGKDQVCLHRYDRKGNFLMQGKALEVYSNVAMALCELTPDKRQMVEAQLKCYEVKGVDAEQLLEQVKEAVPSASDLLGSTGAAVLAPSLALMRLEIDLPDYSVIAYPAIRALEVYMKALMANHGMPVLNQAGFGNYFNRDSLKSGVQAKINCAKTVEAIEKCYALYNDYRHSLFHAEANPEATRVIEKKDEAVHIVHQVLRLLEETADQIP